MTGRDPRRVAAAAIEAAKRNAEAGSLRERIAAEHGLPPSLAGWLRGEGASELSEDARRLAVGIGVVDPEPAEPSEKSPEAEHIELLQTILGEDG